MSSKRCPKCGVYSPASSERCDCGQSLTGVVGDRPREGDASSAMTAAGGVLMALGIAIWIYCFAVFDVSVQVPSGAAGASEVSRVANMERVSTRQNTVGVGAALFVAGSVLLAAGVSRGPR